MCICRTLKCDGLENEEPGSVPRRLLIRKAKEALYEIEIDHSDGDVKEILNNALTTIEKQDGRHETASTRGLDESLRPRRPHSAEQTRTHGKGSPRHHTLVKSPGPPLESQKYTPHKVTLRREFKICGQVGESGQKDKLSYLNLVRQIEIGAGKGHTEK